MDLGQVDVATWPTYEVYLTGCDSRGNPFTRRPCYDTYYDQLQGTSMSAPQVAGAAALLFALETSLTNDAVRSILETTADPISGTGSLWANGRLNVYQAVLAGTDGDTPPTVSVTNPAGGSTVSSTVSVTADASDDDSVSQVEFFVDSDSIGIDTNGMDGWSASWDTTVYADGSYAVSATATDTDGQTSSDSVNVTVDNSVTTKLTVSLIDPDKVVVGDSVDVTISGAGFVAGATVTLENGSGPSPTVSNVVFENATTITATISAKSGGPPRDRVWDVRVTNPGGTSDVLVGGFRVTVG